MKIHETQFLVSGLAGRERDTVHPDASVMMKIGSGCYGSTVWAGEGFLMANDT